MNARKVVLFANTDWYLYNFRLSLAQRLRQDGYEVVLLSPPGDSGPKLQALGFRWEAMPMNRRSLNPLREVFVLAWLVRFLQREKPDLVHGFTIKSAVYGSVASSLPACPRASTRSRAWATSHEPRPEGAAVEAGRAATDALRAQRPRQRARAPESRRRRAFQAGTHRR